MKVFNEETGNGTGNNFLLMLDKKEARTLIDMAEAALESNKRKQSFRNVLKKLESCLLVY